MSASTRAVLNRIRGATPQVYGFLSSVFLGTSVAYLILLSGAPHKLAIGFVSKYRGAHAPSHAGEQAVVALVAALATLIIFLPRVAQKIGRSLKLRLIPLQNWVWAPAVTVFWVAVEWHHMKTAWASLFLAAFAAGAVQLIGRGPARSNPDVSGFLEADLPIPEDGKDLLDRREMVESLVSTILLEPPAIIAITGAYGDGKTSFVNLVIGELRKAEPTSVPVVARFSPWLAADSNSVVLSLLDSVVAEIKREIFVPGLSGDAARYARTLLSAVPWTERLKDLFAEPSQERRIDALVTRIARTRRRVLVVLDDLDRMEAKELETVFKLLRGSDKLSNVTFVCCFDDKEVASILKVTRPTQDTTAYIEKFFPVRFPLPPIGSQQLKDFFVQRLTRVLERSDLPHEDVLNSADQMWEGSIRPHFRNLRRIRVFFNRVSRSLELIAHEVNVWDFVHLELIRDIDPNLYGQIFHNPEFFWSRGLAFEVWSKGPEPFDEKKAKTWRAERYRSIVDSMPKGGQEVLDLLADIFPNFETYRGKSEQVVDSLEAERNKRIFHPRYFWQYFLLKVPSEIFSQKRFASFLTSVRNTDEEAAAIEFSKVFRSIETEDFKRWYFVHLVENRFDEFGPEAQRGLCRGMARNSQLWAIDAFELMTAVACTHTTLGKTPDATMRRKLLLDVVRESASDLYTLDLYWRLQRLEKEGNQTLLPEIQELASPLEEQLRSHYISPDDPPSVFEQYGKLGSGANRIEATQFLFWWQALGQDAQSDARAYVKTILRRRPADLNELLRLMFRVPFIDDYATLKTVVDYNELSKLIEQNEGLLDPEKVRMFRQRYATEVSERDPS